MSTGPNSSFGSVKRVSRYSKYRASISFANMSIIARLGGARRADDHHVLAGDRRDGHQPDDFLLVEELRAHLAGEVLEGRTDARDIDGEAARSGRRGDHVRAVTLPENRPGHAS